MVRISKSSIALLLFLLTVSSKVLSGGVNFNLGQISTNYKMPPYPRSTYTIKSAFHSRENRFKSQRTRENNKITGKYKYHPFRFIYDPRWSGYHGRQYENSGNVIINIIVAGEKDKSIESTPRHQKTVPPPKIVHYNDVFHEQIKKHVKSAGQPQNVILIHGMKISEVNVPLSR